MHSDTYNEMMTARTEGEPEPEPKIVVQAQAAEVDSPLICPTLETLPAPEVEAREWSNKLIQPPADLSVEDIAHFQGDDCPGGHEDDPYLLSPPPPKVDEVAPDGSTIYVRNGVRIAFPGDHTADEVEEAFRGAGF